MPHHWEGAYEIRQIARHRCEWRRPVHILLGYSREGLDKPGEVSVGIDQGLEALKDRLSLEFDRAYLDNGVLVMVEPGGFQVQRYINGPVSR